jgi:hypothetical protein
MRKFFVSTMLATLAALVVSMPAPAAQQNGLVNINVEDNVIQVPIGIAANICDVNAAVLATLTDTGSTECEALSTSTATAMVTRGGGNTRQNGLINVNLENNTIQIPIAAAANVCDVNVVVLATAILFDDASACTAHAGAAGIVLPV